MDYRKVVAIIRRRALPAVEERLLLEKVSGITVTPTKGYGEYANCFGRDLLVPHVRLEIFTASEHVDRIVKAIIESSRTGTTGDGFVAVLPVLTMLRIRTGAEPVPEEL